MSIVLYFTLVECNENISTESVRYCQTKLPLFSTWGQQRAVQLDLKRPAKGPNLSSVCTPGHLLDFRLRPHSYISCVYHLKENRRVVCVCVCAPVTPVRPVRCIFPHLSCVGHGAGDATRPHTCTHTCTFKAQPGHLVPVKGSEALKEFSVQNFQNNRASWLDSAIVCVYSEGAKWSDEVCHCRPVWVFSDSLAWSVS